MERYESLGLVGEGSYGTVLKCRHRDSGRLVAIKKFMDSDDDKTVKKIALREIKLLRQLRHDNLVNLLEVWKRRRRWYLVFEFVERTLLDDLEQNAGGLDLDTGRQYLYQILRAAAFCHQQNIIHRDIKPENILISQGGVVKLCDFGFARAVLPPAEGAAYTDYVATRWYRAPELLVGDTKYGKPVDVWAVGCLLMEMLTGQALFPGDSDLDQIYHIVRCFGNLTAHHQELFHRNPVFSGVRLPECSGRVALEQRFPAVTPPALDLAQRCLQMDPERRAQCSELLEHPLFTQDSFHIRVLDELNAKIQKDHRENSTLPKISKTPRREKDQGDEKNRRGKDKKQAEKTEVNKEKDKKDKDDGDERMSKTKGKPPTKPPKNPVNPSESTKQSKTSGTRRTDDAAKTAVSLRGKPGKAAGAELRKDPEVLKPAKTLTEALAAFKTPTDVKDGRSVAAKAKAGKAATPEPTEVHSHPSLTRASNPESWSHSNTKGPKLSIRSDPPNKSSSPKPLKPDHVNTNVTQKLVSTKEPKGATKAKTSKNDRVETSSPLRMFCRDGIPACSATPPSELWTDRTTEPRRTSQCPKVPSSNPEQPSPKTTQNITPVSSETSALSSVFREVSTAPPTGGSSSDSKPSNDSTRPGCASSNKDIEDHDGFSEKTQATETDRRHVERSAASSGDNEETSTKSTESKTTKESRTSPTTMLCETSTPKTLKVSDKENREDLALSLSISPTTKSSKKVSGGSNVEPKTSSSGAEPADTKTLRSKSLTVEPKTKSRSSGNPPKSIWTQKTRFYTDRRKKRENSTNMSAVADSSRLDRGATLHHADPADHNGFSSSPPPPPPPPSSTPLLLPPTSTPLIPSYSPAAGDHLGRGGTPGLRFVEKAKHHGSVCSHLSAHLTAAQVSERSPIRQRSFLSDRCNHGDDGGGKNKPDVHFPDVRRSALPELRGHEGKQIKGTSKDQRRDRQPVPAEPQQNRHGRTGSDSP